MSPEQSQIYNKGDITVMEEKRNLTFPMYLTWKDGCIEVVGDFTKEFNSIIHGICNDLKPGEDQEEFSNEEIIETCKHLQNGKGYVINDLVYVYYDKKPKRVTSPVPFFTVTIRESNNYRIEARTPAGPEETQKNFSIDKMVNYSYEKILAETTGNEVLYDEDMLNDMNSARSKFIPIVNKKDDYLKKLIKYVIIKKDVDINRYKSAMDTPYALTNMKSALIASTKMSVTNFLMWVELLGVDFEILVEDNGMDPVNPMKESLLYRSRDNATYTFDASKCMFTVEDREKLNEVIEKEKIALVKIPDQMNDHIEEDPDEDIES